ncbi:MAG TPA: hypothetical protein VIX63_06660 [Vicinamibacterales bacterium]
MKAHSHLSDDQLLELCLGGDERPVAGCAACETRRADLAALLDEVSDAAACHADAAFPADRLARQQARILQRIEQDGRPGRIIAFPGHGQEAALLRDRPRARWIAAAAVAGLVIGLLAGHLQHDLLGRVSAPSVPAVRTTDAPDVPTLRAVSEDEFLDQIEMAADSPGPGTALRPLHDVTPRAWEVNEIVLNEIVYESAATIDEC